MIKVSSITEVFKNSSETYLLKYETYLLTWNRKISTAFLVVDVPGCFVVTTHPTFLQVTILSLISMPLLIAQQS